MLLGTGVMLVLYRYITGTLGVALLGVWSVVLAAASASRLANMGVGSGMTRFVAKYRALNDMRTAAIMVETSAVTLSVVLGVMLPILYFPVKIVLAHVFSGQYLTEARVLLPYALVSLWLGDVAGVFESALDGMQRMELRAGIVVTGQVLKLGLAIWLMPTHGLIGLAEAQVAQGVYQLLAGWILLRSLLPTLRRLPLRWSCVAFRELIGYGANLQLASLFMMLMDPLTKAFMAKYGSATAAGYFEMANQLALKVRALIVTANQAIVPKVTEIGTMDPSRIANLYRFNMSALVFVTLPITAILIVCSGGASWVLVGEYRLQLVHLIEIFAVAWGFNTFTGPAYFINMGTGQVRWNTISHVLMGILNVLLCWVLGARFAAEGVVFSYAIALVVPSALLIAVFSKGLGAHCAKQFQREDARLLGAAMLLALVGHGAVVSPADIGLTSTYLELAIPLILMGLALWSHPIGRMMRKSLVIRRT